MPFNAAWEALLEHDFVAEWQLKVQTIYDQQPDGLYPHQDHVFRAFDVCPLDQLKVVIVGEEPYDNGDADGLAFSVAAGARVPLSLCNILSEIVVDLGIPVPHDGNLERWAHQGVLLLNSSLTAGHNTDIEWADFVTAVLRKIRDREHTNIVFMFWGAEARKRQTSAGIVDDDNHRVLTSTHPAPQGAWQDTHSLKPFIGCRHFSQANTFLEERSRDPVDWG